MPQPRSRPFVELLRADAEATSRPHRWGAAASDPTLAELANASDAMVADVSGVVTDFMQSLKPFAMVATGDKTDTFRARFPSSRAAYVIEWDLYYARRCASTRCSVPTHLPPFGSNVTITTSEVMKATNPLARLSDIYNRWPKIRRLSRPCRRSSQFANSLRKSVCSLLANNVPLLQSVKSFGVLRLIDDLGVGFIGGTGQVGRKDGSLVAILYCEAAVLLSAVGRCLSSFSVCSGV